MLRVASGQLSRVAASTGPTITRVAARALPCALPNVEEQASRSFGTAAGFGRPADGIKNMPSHQARLESTFSVAIDLDGTLYRGSDVFPESTPSLQRLRENHIPLCLLTNGGGDLETSRAQSLSTKLGVDLQPNQLQLCHSPMQDLAHTLGDKQVLLVGRDNILDIAAKYGFTKGITADMYHARFQSAYPDIPAMQVNQPYAWWEQKFEAIIIIMEPWNYARDFQIVVDVARSNGLVGTIADNPMIPVYSSCPDLQYVNEFPLPRFGAGMFSMCVQDLYRRLTNKELHITHYGKPNSATYRHAEINLDSQAKELGYTGVHRIYMIGDNPAIDIFGANHAGDLWSSVLVKTGVFEGEDNDEEFPADFVADHIGAAVEMIIRHEEQLRLQQQEHLQEAYH